MIFSQNFEAMKASKSDGLPMSAMGVTLTDNQQVVNSLSTVCWDFVG